MVGLGLAGTGDAEAPVDGDAASDTVIDGRVCGAHPISAIVARRTPAPGASARRSRAGARCRKPGLITPGV